ncbi:hypothetical protein [Paenibacillus silviterrae]|uniref:hypothetical protein n=1 Tax=Paenibacillus silviterrae TaxID=3242194 RepID=UPI0025429839|nr:hypothetical protein [Paenibacillus chinjuensis]
MVFVEEKGSIGRPLISGVGVAGRTDCCRERMASGKRKDKMPFRGGEVIRLTF